MTKNETTHAARLLDQIQQIFNDGEAGSASGGELRPIDLVWERIIDADGYDDDATDDADPTGNLGLAVFTDGSTLEWVDSLGHTEVFAR